MKGSITKSFGALLKGDAQPEQGPPTPTPAPDPFRHSARVGAGVVGAASRTLTDIRQERDDLKAQLASAGLTELSPEVIDPSPFSDRLGDDSNDDFEALKRTIEEEGQKVAIQVRAHPKRGERYQVVYGHRRLRACRELGRSVRVQLVTVSDEELAIAQGIENSARQDLTWIEKALFAWRLEKAGIKAKGIRVALSVDDSELAKFRVVCRAVPTEIIEAIGRAPHVGRPRWIELATAAGGSPDALKGARKTLAAAQDLGSDQRFARLMDTLKPEPAEKHIPELKTPDGRAFGTVVGKGRDIRMKLVSQDAADFAGFLEGELPQLIAKFLASQGAEKNP